MRRSDENESNRLITHRFELNRIHDAREPCVDGEMRLAVIAEDSFVAVLAAATGLDEPKRTRTECRQVGQNRGERRRIRAEPRRQRSGELIDR